MGMDRHAVHGIPRIRAVDHRLPGLLGGLLRRQALRPQGRVVGDGHGALAAELPQLVPGPLSIRLRQVPVRRPWLRTRPRRPPASPGAEDRAEPAPGAPERGRRRRKPAADPAAPACAMSIHAHPDDQEFTVGGTLAKWARSGSRVITVCITSGGAGSNQSTPLDMTREALVPIREEEQRRACQALGISDVVFLGYEDGVLEPSIALRRDLTRIIRRYKPDAVVCGDPTVRFY